MPSISHKHIHHKPVRHDRKLIIKRQTNNTDQSESDINQLKQHERTNIDPIQQTNQLVYKQSNQPKPVVPVQPDKILSKSEQRKLRRINEEKYKKLHRTSYIDTLNKHQIKQAHSKLLHSSSSINTNDTYKQKVYRLYAEHKAGLIDVENNKELRNLLFTSYNTDDTQHSQVEFNQLQEQINNELIKNSEYIDTHKRKRVGRVTGTIIHNVADAYTYHHVNHADKHSDSRDERTVDNENTQKHNTIDHTQHTDHTKSMKQSFFDTPVMNNNQSVAALTEHELVDSLIHASDVQHRSNTLKQHSVSSHTTAAATHQPTSSCNTDHNQHNNTAQSIQPSNSLPKLDYKLKPITGFKTHKKPRIFVLPSQRNTNKDTPFTTQHGSSDVDSDTTFDSAMQQLDEQTMGRSIRMGGSDMSDDSDNESVVDNQCDDIIKLASLNDANVSDADSSDSGNDIINESSNDSDSSAGDEITDQRAIRDRQNRKAKQINDELAIYKNIKHLHQTNNPVTDSTIPILHDNGDVTVMGVTLKQKEQLPYVSSNYENLGVDNHINDMQFLMNDTITNNHDHTSHSVQVNRTPDVILSRSQLPIIAQEHDVMDTIQYNDIVILIGETGSGKTTQLPQFLYERNYCTNHMKICITEPRRVAAVSTAQRVQYELNDTAGIVSYNVRFNSTVNKSSKIIYMTDGILLREIQYDTLLLQYSVILLDEIHERGLNTDLLIGYLSRLVVKRRSMHTNKQSCNNILVQPLKLIIMSATTDSDALVNNRSLFEQPPIIFRIDQRQYNVGIHFLRHTPYDPTQATLHKLCQVHCTLPAGAILAFLPGKYEIDTIVKKMNELYDNTKFIENTMLSDQFTRRERKLLAKQTKQNVQNNGDGVLTDELYDLNGSDDMIGDEYDGSCHADAELTDDSLHSQYANKSRYRIKVLPLYSMLSHNEQLRVFEPVDTNTRLIVIATNIAETSLTIPNIKYVIDCGLEKVRVINHSTGVISYITQRISQSSAEQRSGRAGRTTHGHAYRLYSSAVYQSMNKYTEPEIYTSSIDNIVLLMKSMGIQSPDRFPLPSPFRAGTVQQSISHLQMLGALDGTPNMDITALGRSMVLLPLLPRYSVMLLNSYRHNCIQYMIRIVSILSSPQLIHSHKIQLNDHDKHGSTVEQWNKLQGVLQKRYNDYYASVTDNTSDVLTELNVVILYEAELYRYGQQYNTAPHNKSTIHHMQQYCHQHNLNYKNMVELGNLISQITSILTDCIPTSNTSIHQQLQSTRVHTFPDDQQRIELRHVLLSGYIDHIVRKMTEQMKQSRFSDYDKYNPQYKYIYESFHIQQPIYIHRDSVFYVTDDITNNKLTNNYMVYTELNEKIKHKQSMIDNTGQNQINENSSRFVIRGCTEIDVSWLAEFKHICEIQYNKQNRIYYDTINDCMKQNVNLLFHSTYRWNIDNVKILYTGKQLYDITYYQNFVYCILHGDVFQSIKSSVELKLINMLQLPYNTIVQQLQRHNLYSKKLLLQQWNQNQTFLKYELMPYVINKKWPPR